MKQSIAWPQNNQSCIICNLPAQLPISLCSICYTRLPWHSDYCSCCGALLHLGYESITCNKCTHSTNKYNNFYTLFSYQPPISNMLLQLKFANKLYIADLLGKILCQHILDIWYTNQPLPQAIIPVPLFRQRHTQRGYNQVWELLRPYAKQPNHIPILWDICQRIINTPPQSLQRRATRKKNLQHAFGLTKKLSLEHVAIVDDIVTTGSTVRALQNVLTQHNVELVDIWCIAKA